MLLLNDDFKITIINSWRNLVKRDLIAVYGFIIMPNHIHILGNEGTQWQRNTRQQLYEIHCT